MNVLLVCPYFPPENTIAAERIGKFAKHLTQLGDSVRVISRVPPLVDHSELPGEGDQYADVDKFTDPTAAWGERLRRRRLIAGTEPLTDFTESALTNPRDTILEVLRGAVRGIRAGLLIPDQFIFWALRAKAGVRSGGWVPDVIVASGGPISSFLVARHLSKKYRVHWIADYRDLLSSGHYYMHGRVRRFIDRSIEARTVRTSSARTTVSAPMARDLTEWLGGRCEVVQNGFDPDDFVDLEPIGAPGEELVISFLGYIYRHRRDPTPLFQALALLSVEDLPIKVRFYGTNVFLLRELAEREGVLDHVEFNPRVTHSESLRVQVSSDVLLQLMWNDPREVGNYTGKLFEYVAARRPILMLGYEHGVAADLIRDRSLGVIANDPRDIADALRRWSKEKREHGRLMPLPVSGGLGLSRQAQAKRLRSLLLQVTGG